MYFNDKTFKILTRSVIFSQTTMNECMFIIYYFSIVTCIEGCVKDDCSGCDCYEGWKGDDCSIRGT